MEGKPLEYSLFYGKPPIAASQIIAEHFTELSEARRAELADAIEEAMRDWASEYYDLYCEI